MLASPVFDDVVDVPDGYVRLADGHLAPVNGLSDVDLLRNEFVMGWARKMWDVHCELAGLKEAFLSELEAFYALSAEESGGSTGFKSQVSMLSLDGLFKIECAKQAIMGFNEKLAVAEELVGNCLRRWTEEASASDELKSIVALAFSRSAAGKLNISSLRRLLLVESKDVLWLEAMAVLRDSFLLVSKKQYVRVYYRAKPSVDWVLISLNWSMV